jgi:hypothetical protein
MTSYDYVAAVVLVLLVIPQVSGTRLTLRNLLLPLALVVLIGALSLRSIPRQGNDDSLYEAAVVVGFLFGAGCAYNTRLIRLTDGGVMAKAGFLAAALWIAGMATRLLFVYEEEHGGQAAIDRFSRERMISGTAAWGAALIFMALAQVVSRVVLLRTRRAENDPR